MENKEIKLNFYQISQRTYQKDTDEEIKEKFEEVSNAFKVKKDDFTALSNNRDNSTVNLLRKKLHADSNGLIYGTLIYNQKTDIPFVYDDITQLDEELSIEEDKGLGHDTSFVFDPSINIVMIESVKNGVGISNFCQFFAQNFGLRALEYGIVINPTEIDKLNNMTSISNFEVKIATLQSGKPFAGKNVSANKIINAADNTNTDTLHMQLSVGYNREESLNINTIKKYIRDFLKLKSKDNKELKKLTVVGKVGDDSYSEPIDFIKERLKDKIEVTRLRFNNLDSLNERYKRLTAVYMEHKQSLRDAYKLKKI